MDMKQYKRVLTIAGSDSGGGAGIQADIKTIEACGCYASSAITAITVQNTLGVNAVHAIPTDIISGQIDAVLSDIGADAVKIGMLANRDVICCVRDALVRNPVRCIVLDPVMVSTSGCRLIEEAAIESLCTDLIPFATVITPNIPEAEILLGIARGRRTGKPGQNAVPARLEKQSQLPDAARELSGAFGGVSVLLKAGHLTEEKLVDIFYDATEDRIYGFASDRIHTGNTHGTGCTMSSAFASMLALGRSLPEAAEAAKKYVDGAIRSGAEYTIGHGFGPVHHFYGFWE